MMNMKIIGILCMICMICMIGVNVSGGEYGESNNSSNSSNSKRSKEVDNFIKAALAQAEREGNKRVVVIVINKGDELVQEEVRNRRVEAAKVIRGSKDKVRGIGGSVGVRLEGKGHLSSNLRARYDEAFK